MTRIFLLLAALVALTACGGRSARTACSSEAARVAETIATANTAGTYAGTLPAADCPGIAVCLTLCDDGTYISRSEYLERDGRFEERGRYTIEGELLTLRPDADEPEWRCRIEAGQLRMLDTAGRAIEGPMAECYILTRKTE